MAINPATPGDTVHLSLALSGTPSANAYSLIAWIKLKTALTGSNYQTALAHVATTTKSQFWGQPSWETPATCFSIRNDCGGVNDTAHWTTAPTTGNWYGIALTGGATYNKGYFYTWNGSSLSLVNSAVASISVGSPGAASLLSAMAVAGEANSQLDCKMCFLRAFSVEKDQNAIEAELLRSYIYDTANCYSALGACTASGFENDVSGNGRNWTRGAGLSTSDFDSDVPSGLLTSGGIFPFNARQGGGFLDMGSLRG